MYGIGHHGAQKVESMYDSLPVAIGTISAAGMYMLLGNGDAFPVADQVTKIVGATSFGGLVWYLIVKHLPAIQDRHDEQVRDLTAYQHQRDEQIGKLVEAVNRELKGLRDDIRKKCDE